MPPFPKPRFSYQIDVGKELQALRDYERDKPGRAIPDKRENNLLLATWNIANLGLQIRTHEAYRLIAEICSWFDVVAVQEVHDNIEGIRAIQSQLPRNYRMVFSDSSGNDERLAFIYDSMKAILSEEIGEVAFPPSELRHVKLTGVDHVFTAFDRNPYLCTFTRGSFVFSLVNCHSYFGGDDQPSMDRRTLETYAIARWTDLRRGSSNAFTKDIVVLGDLNLPKAQPGDRVFEALTKRGLHIPKHSTQVASAIASDNHYDQVAFFPGETQKDFVRSGVFDFDGGVFTDLWEDRGEKDFKAFVRYYLSDHRPLWAEFKTG